MAGERICVVAGVGPGVGAAVARRFAREGYAVALMARRAEALEAVVADIEAEGGSARAFPVDLADLAALDAAFAAVRAQMGPPEALIYNAGRWIETPGMTLTPADLEAELRLGVVGALAATQAVWPGMRAAGRGTVMWTGGGLALAPQYGAAVPALTAAKSALRGLAFAVAPELAAAGVRLATVTIAGAVAPGGPFDPDLIAETFWAAHAAPAGPSPVEHVFSGAPG